MRPDELRRSSTVAIAAAHVSGATGVAFGSGMEEGAGAGVADSTGAGAPSRRHPPQPPTNSAASDTASVSCPGHRSWRVARGVIAGDGSKIQASGGGLPLLL